MYIQSGEMLGIVGAYYGIVLDAIFLGGTPQRINVTGSRKNFLLRFGVVMLIWFLPIYKLGDLSRSQFKTASDYQSEYLVRFAIPYFFCSIVLFSFSKVLMKRMGIINFDQK